MANTEENDLQTGVLVEEARSGRRELVEQSALPASLTAWVQYPRDQTHDRRIIGCSPLC